MNKDSQDTIQKIYSLQKHTSKKLDKLKKYITSYESQVRFAENSISYMKAFNDIVTSTANIRSQIQGSRKQGNLQETESKLSSILQLLDIIKTQKYCVNSVIKSGKELIDSGHSISDDMKSKITTGNLTLTSNQEKLVKCWEKKKSEYEEYIIFLKEFESMDLRFLSLEE